jgi:hypothetical protein
MGRSSNQRGANLAAEPIQAVCVDSGAVSKHWRYVVGIGVALVVAVAIAAAVSSRGNDGAESPSEPPAARQSANTTRGADWVAEANTVCRLGRKLYPNIAVGAAGDPDTTDYAISRLVREIAAIAMLPPSSGGHELELQGQAAVAAWHSLATRNADTVTLGDKQEAARIANRYIDQLVAFRAAACAPLRLRTGRT